tara:strand:- start:181 stop:360 length:180 start_codon:yes stop_codon:yes gene_type:complete
MGFVKGIIDKVGSRKLGVTAAVGAVALTDGIEITWPVALVACCYLLSQAIVDTWGNNNG